MAAPRLAYLRSLELHRAVAAKLIEDPAVIERARRKLEEWLAAGGRSAPLWRRWQEILSGSAEEIAAFLEDPSEEAAWLRKASPFAGVLTPSERVRIIKETRAQLESTA